MTTLKGFEIVTVTAFFKTKVNYNIVSFRVNVVIT